MKIDPMKKLSQYHRTWRKFMAFWTKYYDLNEDYIGWALHHAEILQFDRYETLCVETHMQRNLYFVSEGLLARAQIDPDTGRRTIYQIAGANQALFTRYHRYSRSTPPGDIVALKRTFVVKIPYKAINVFVPDDLPLSKLLLVLGERNDKYQIRLSDVKTHRKAEPRYRSFFTMMPDYRDMLTIHQQADLLEMSPTAIKSFRRVLLKAEREGKLDSYNTYLR